MFVTEKTKQVAGKRHVSRELPRNTWSKSAILLQGRFRLAVTTTGTLSALRTNLAGGKGNHALIWKCSVVLLCVSVQE